MAKPRSLSREQLSKFLPDHESIKAFERIIQFVGVDAAIESQDKQITEGIIDAKVNNLASTVSNLQNDLLNMIINSRQDAILEKLQSISDGLEILCSKPYEIKENFTNVDYIDFNPNGSHVTQAYRQQWNNDDGTYDFGLLNGVIWQGGQEIFYYAKNTSGSTILNGSAVMSDGTIGASGKIKIVPAIADGSIDAQHMLGIATQDIANNEFGYITAFGLVRGINTSGSVYSEVWADGDMLYFNPNIVGGLTNIEPIPPNLKLPVALVIYATNSNAGSIYVRMTNGQYLSGLHDVYITSPMEGQVLKYDSTNSRWINTDKLPQLYIGDYDAGNYTYIDNDGFQEDFGDSRTYDDVYPSAASVGVGANAPLITSYSGNLQAYEFVGVATLKQLTFQFQLYHSYAEGTDVFPHIHLYIPDDITGGNIKFFCEYSWSNVGDAGAISTTTVSGTITRGASEGIAKNAVLSFDSLTGTGKQISSILTARIYRDPSDIEDTFGSSVWLLSADVHILTNTRGSKEEFLK